MARNKRGDPVQEVRTTNPLALSIVNARANRDCIDASVAAGLIIVESQNQPANSNQVNPGGQANNPQSLSSPRENRPGFLNGINEK